MKTVFDIPPKTRLKFFVGGCVFAMVLGALNILGQKTSCALQGLPSVTVSAMTVVCVDQFAKPTGARYPL